jgi:hypothetical protein
MLKKTEEYRFLLVNVKGFADEAFFFWKLANSLIVKMSFARQEPCPLKSILLAYSVYLVTAT